MKKLVELHQKSGDSHAMKFLWRETFDGRRVEITTGLVTDSGILLRDKCPLLNQFTYVSIHTPVIN